MSIISVENLDRIYIGTIIKENRLSNGMTQSELAEALDVDSSYISKIERGKGLSLSLVVSIARILDFSLDDIVPGKNKDRIAEVGRLCARYSNNEIDLFIGAGKGAIEAYRRMHK